MCTEMNTNRAKNDASVLPSIYLREQTILQSFNLRNANLLYGLPHNSIKSGYIVKLTLTLLWLTAIRMSVLQ